MNCQSVDDVKEHSIDIVAKARLLFNKIIEFKSNNEVKVVVSIGAALEIY
jgi:hypothetical protein